MPPGHGWVNMALGIGQHGEHIPHAEYIDALQNLPGDARFIDPEPQNANFAAPHRPNPPERNAPNDRLQHAAPPAPPNPQPAPRNNFQHRAPAVVAPLNRHHPPNAYGAPLAPQPDPYQHLYGYGQYGAQPVPQYQYGYQAMQGGPIAHYPNHPNGLPAAHYYMAPPPAAQGPTQQLSHLLYPFARRQMRTLVEEVLFVARALISRKPVQTSFQFQTDIVYDDFRSRCLAKFDDPAAQLAYKITDDPKRPDPFELIDASQFQDAMKRLNRKCASATSREQEIFIFNVRPGAEQSTGAKPSTSLGTTKRSRQDAMIPGPLTIPESLTEFEKGLWRSLNKHLRCEKHQHTCIIDTKGGKTLHIPVSYDIKELWISFIKRQKATVFRPPHAVEVELLKLKKKAWSAREAAASHTSSEETGTRIISEVHLNINGQKLDVQQPATPSSSKKRSHRSFGSPLSPNSKRLRQSTLSPSSRRRCFPDSHKASSSRPPLRAPQFDESVSPPSPSINPRLYPTIHDALVELDILKPGAGYLLFEDILKANGIYYINDLNILNPTELAGHIDIPIVQLGAICEHGRVGTAKVDAEVAAVDVEQRRTDWSEEIFRDKENYRMDPDSVYGDEDGEIEGEGEGADDDEGDDDDGSWGEVDFLGRGAENGYVSDGEGLGEECT
ncbi:uncharacterized protein STEHIDRAFT_152661 [Stereum hirsutum FP-91666 SS1]|uniref:uncharacterized protein n=1 Tax=Stereum hirsutum (strain FP-91666) TaxID=721885 RepID=UPI000440A793|nr:uncharacterized protein STEHIDRAFT_152661 [Stereum hirsutum FP-91666 SS1]EIM90980.1 hypothetical protein STEHIDRAFT_152661 [Stereum hirsutum FP-91666 SS1]